MGFNSGFEGLIIVVIDSTLLSLWIRVYLIMLTYNDFAINGNYVSRRTKHSKNEAVKSK